MLIRTLFSLLTLSFILFGCVNHSNISNKGKIKNGDVMEKRVLFIIAPEKFRDEELLYTKEEIENAGIQTTIASTRKGECHGMLGAVVEATKNLTEVNVNDYDAIIFVGGSGTPIVRSNDDAIRIVKEAYNSSHVEILGAICWAPTILAKAGVLKGKHATLWKGNDEEYGMTTPEVIEKYGATYVEKPVVEDGKIITAWGPSAAHQFGKQIADRLLSNDE